MATPAPAGMGYSQASFYSSLGSSCWPCRGSGRSSSPLLRHVLAYPALRTAVISGPAAPPDVPAAAGPQPPSLYAGLCARSMATFTRTSSWRGDGDDGRRAPTLPCSRWMRVAPSFSPALLEEEVQEERFRSIEGARSASESRSSCTARSWTKGASSPADRCMKPLNCGRQLLPLEGPSSPIKYATEGVRGRPSPDYGPPIATSDPTWPGQTASDQNKRSWVQRPSVLVVNVYDLLTEKVVNFSLRLPAFDLLFLVTKRLQMKNNDLSVTNSQGHKLTYFL
uniref:Uncharacterized protein n=1 Tax=Aegilops tauschii TaxID=37682 RepID=M8CAI4_AEGTA